MPVKNDRLLRAINKQPIDRTPIWIMRQAGRYLPEYRAIRAQAGSFMKLCQTPELACEVTLQPLRRFDLDASIIFSDILTIPDAMGLGLSFVENEGPRFAHPTHTEAQINQLQVPDPEQLSYVYEAIQLTTKELTIPLIGFAGSPWTLAAYMVEGRSKTDFPTLRKMLIEAPDLLHKLLNTLAKSVASHLSEQIKAGVQAVMIFDTWGGILNTAQYQEFSLNYQKQIISTLKQNYNNSKVPIILFTKRGNKWLEQIAASGCDMIGVDWEITLQQARERVGKQTALQGNMDPATLLKTPTEIYNEAKQILASYGKGSGHVFNLGHGITPNVPPENLKVLVDAVHELSEPYHQ